MNRRDIIPMLGLAPVLAGCGGETANVRFRVIAKVTVDGDPVEASTVMEVKYSRVTNSLIGAGGATQLWGEALILDLKGRRTVYILPLAVDSSGALIHNLYEGAVLRSFGITNSIGVLEDRDFERLRTASGRVPFNYFSKLPAFVAFRDEKIPNTVYEINPRQMAQSFPGVEFVGLDIEIVDSPISTGLQNRLQWLVSPTEQPAFDRDKPGHQRSAKDEPIGYKIGYISFIRDGW